MNFIYIIILLILLLINKTVLGIILFVTGVLCIVYYYYTLNPDIILENDKYEKIKPKPENKYTDIINFLFSVQELHSYNEQVFENIVDKLDKFVSLYETILLNKDNTNTHYDLMNRTKYDILNDFHTLVISLPSDPNIINKHKKAVNILEDILNKYLGHILYLHKKNLYINGYTTRYKEIINGPVEHNYSTNSFI